MWRAEDCQPSRVGHRKWRADARITIVLALSSPMPSLDPRPLVPATILVIDDEPQIRRLIRNALTESGYRVLEADNGAAGVDRAAAEQPALVILDLGLPDGDGLEICRELRSFTQVPIVVLSARHSEREKEALLDAGADDYVTPRVSAESRRSPWRPGPGCRRSA
jgi:CheY-like chemotaxis protein